MAKTAFNELTIKNLKPKDKTYVKRENRGFAIRVLPSGVTTWLYIYTINGKQKWLSLGQYPGITLSAARIAYNKAHEKYQQGKDPAAIKQKDKDADSIEALVEEFIERGLKQKGNRSWKKYKRNLDKDVLPNWRHRKAKDIKKRDVIKLLDKIVDRGAKNQSTQVFKIVRRMFNFAVERDILEFSPCAGLKPPTPTVTKDRTLTDDEIKTFWHGLDNAYMGVDIKRALKLILVTAQRPGEVIGAHSNEIEGSLWTIPGERTKNKCAHKVYLTPLAKELFQLGGTGHLFLSTEPGVDDKGEEFEKAISVNAVAKALRRALRGSKRKNGEMTEPTIKMAPFTPHDLRRTATTNMASLGFGVIVDKVLNHTDQRVTAAYDHYDYAKEKQEALEAHTKRIELLVTGKQTGKQTSNVIPFKKR